MYLAIKWLVFLTLAMWLALCCLESKKSISCTDPSSSVSSAFQYERNISISGHRPLVQLDQKLSHKFVSKKSGSSYNLMYYLSFIAGALVVTIYNRRAEILVFVSELLNFFTSNYKRVEEKTKLWKKIVKLYLNQTVVTKIRTWVANVAIQENSLKLWYIVKDAIQVNSSKMWPILIDVYTMTKKTYFKFKSDPKVEEGHINELLLNKLKELGNEHKNLGQLLIAAIQENKNIRLRLKLESMAKSRLIRHLEEIDKQIKAYRSRYMALKQQQLVIREENLYLKARAQKLSTEKETVVNNFITLVEEMHNIPDLNIKAICSDIMHSVDINGDSNSICLRGLRSTASTSTQSSGKYPLSLRSTVSLYGLSCEGEESTPKLLELPEEYPWIVKNNRAMIKTLLEYRCGYTDNCHTVQRISEECLFDFTKSPNTTAHETSRMASLNMKTVPVHRLALTLREHSVTALPTLTTVDVATASTTLPRPLPLETVGCTMSLYNRCQIQTREFSTTHRFLTGSKAFQSFLRNNKQCCSADELFQSGDAT